MALRSGPSKETQRSDSLEERLAKAEKEVAIALDTFAYDELIDMASEALEHQPQAPSKAVIKSRKNLLWARSHAYHHKALHAMALKDAKAALKLDPDDIAAYVRAAVLLDNAGHKEKAISCLDTAESLASKYDAGTRTLWLRRIEKQRTKLSKPSSRITDRLPHEILIQIASHLGSLDLNSMSQTCRRWRQILTSASTLWTSLTMRLDVQFMKDQKALEWIRYIAMRSERANHCLESVDFAKQFPEALLGKVCGILRSSSATLKSITIPADRQVQFVYDQLLRYCPRLESLVFIRLVPVSVRNSVLDAFPDAPMPDSRVTELFSLKRLSVCFSADSTYKLFKDHIGKLRYLKGYNPFAVTASREFEDHLLALSLAENLEEWDCGDAEVQSCFLTLNLNFPNLTTLSRFNMSGMTGPMNVSFPRLLDLDVVVSEDHGNIFVRLLQNSPMLRKLQFLSVSIAQFGVDLRPALLGLRDLEHVKFSTIGSDDMGHIFPDLLPRAVSLETGQIDLYIPWMKLHTLTFSAEAFDLTKVAFALLVRERLRLGDNLTAAKQLASDRLSTLPKGSAPALSPFQRGSSSHDTPTPTLTPQGPSLKDTTAIARLQRLELLCISEVTEKVKVVLDSVTDELIMKLTPW